MDPDQFWQIHRGTIVNASRLSQVGHSLTGREVVRLKDRSETLTASHRYNHLFKQMGCRKKAGKKEAASVRPYDLGFLN